MGCSMMQGAQRSAHPESGTYVLSGGVHGINGQEQAHYSRVALRARYPEGLLLVDRHIHTPVVEQHAHRVGAAKLAHPPDQLCTKTKARIP